jgi:hypothetical protein
LGSGSQATVGHKASTLQGGAASKRTSNEREVLGNGSTIDQGNQIAKMKEKYGIHIGRGFLFGSAKRDAMQITWDVELMGLEGPSMAQAFKFLERQERPMDGRSRSNNDKAIEGRREGVDEQGGEDRRLPAPAPAAYQGGARGQAQMKQRRVLRQQNRPSGRRTSQPCRVLPVVSSFRMDDGLMETCKSPRVMDMSMGMGQIPKDRSFRMQ